MQPLSDLWTIPFDLCLNLSSSTPSLSERGGSTSTVMTIVFVSM
jgi:hypothetical protein